MSSTTYIDLPPSLISSQRDCTFDQRKMGHRVSGRNDEKLQITKCWTKCHLFRLLTLRFRSLFLKEPRVSLSNNPYDKEFLLSTSVFDTRQSLWSFLCRFWSPFVTRRAGLLQEESRNAKLGLKKSIAQHLSMALGPH